MSTRLELHLLGKLHVAVDGRAHTNSLSVKAQAILFYLAVTGEAHSRYALAGLLWGDVPDDKAKNSLRVTLAALRKVCPDHLDISHLTIGLNVASEVWLDVTTFAAGLQNTADLSHLRQTLDLYRGDFLEDLHVESSLAFEEWVLHQRTYWQQQALRGFTHLSQALMSWRNYNAVITVNQRRLTLDPWAESQLQQALALFRQQQDLGQIGRALNSLGNVLMSMGKTGFLRKDKASHFSQN